MTRSAGRPTESHDDRRVQVGRALVEAANGLLTDGGTYVDLSVNAMVAKAGIAKSTFYQYFTGKNDLLTNFVEQALGLAGENLDWFGFEDRPTQQSMAVAVRDRVLGIRPYWPLLAAAFDAAYFDPEVKHAVDQLLWSLMAGAAEHIRRGQQRGWIDPDLPPAQTAMWLTWMAERGLHKLVIGADEDRIDALIAGFCATAWSILYRPVMSERAGQRLSRGDSGVIDESA